MVDDPRDLRGAALMLDDVVRWRDLLWVIDGLDSFGFAHLWPHRKGYFASGAPCVDCRYLELVNYGMPGFMADNR